MDMPQNEDFVGAEISVSKKVKAMANESIDIDCRKKYVRMRNIAGRMPIHAKTSVWAGSMQSEYRLRATLWIRAREEGSRGIIKSVSATRACMCLPNPQA